MSKTFRITSPEGKTYDVTGPDDGTPEQALQQVQSQVKATPAAPPTANPDVMKAIDAGADKTGVRQQILALPEDQQDANWNYYAKAAVDKEREAGFQPAPMAGKGLPIVGGLLDEGAAAIESIPNLVTGGNYGPSYSEALAIQRERERRASEAHPVMDTVGTLGTGLLGPGAFLKSGAGVLSNTMRGIGAGGVFGGAHGFTSGEGGFENRVEGAKTGAQVGAIIGGLFPAGIAGGARAAGMLHAAIAPKLASKLGNNDKAAAIVLGNKLKKAGVTPQDVMRYLDEGRETAKFGTGQAHLPETIADVNDTMQRTAGSIYRTGGEAAEQTKSFLNERQRGPRNRYDPQPDEMPGQLADVRDATARALQVKTKPTAYKQEQATRATQKSEADTLYQRARDNSQDFDIQPAIDAAALRAQEHGGAFRSEIDKAISLYANRDMATGAQRAVNNVTRFDNAKKQLDYMIEQSYKDGRPTQLTRELMDFKRALDRNVYAPDEKGNPTINKDYHAARDAYASRAEELEAIDLGRRALDEDTEVTLEQLAALTNAQKKLARQGFMGAIDKRQARKKPGDNATLLFQEKRTADVMNALAPGEVKGPQFGEYMARQENMSTTRNTALGGSPTAKNLQDDAENAAEVMATAWDKMRQAPGWFNVAMEAASGAMRKMFGYNQEVAKAMAKRLFATDRAEQLKALAEIRMHMGQQDFEKFTAAMGRVGRATAIQAGNANAKREDQPIRRLSDSKPPRSLGQE